MTLRVALVIDGNASGAVKAAGDAGAALAGMTKQAAAAAGALDAAVNDNIASLARLQSAAANAGGGAPAANSLAAKLNAQFGIDQGGDSTAVLLQQGQALDAIRAKYNPLFAAQQQYRAQLVDLKGALAQGAINQDEYAAAVTDTKVAFIGQVNALRPGRDALAETSTAARAAAGAIGGAGQAAKLSGQQVAELGHIARSTTGIMLAGGDAFTALGYEANRILSVLTIGPSGVGGTLKAIGGIITGLLSPTVLTTGAVLALGAAGVIASAQYNSGQRAVAQALTGVGQASGALISDINRIAEQSSSAFGLSVSEAREFASALAATGRIGEQQIGSLSKLGGDFAKAFGEDASAAAKTLATAFADPAKGAAALNEKLGFLDASTLKLIADLQAQNRVTEAQQVLQQRLAGSLAAMQPQLAMQTGLWSAFGNVISNSWDALGSFISRSTGFGLTLGLDEQIAETKKAIADLEAAQSGRGSLFGLIAGSYGLNVDQALEAERAKLAELTGQWQRYEQEVTAAQARRDSFAQRAAVENVAPEIGQLNKLNNTFISLSRSLAEVNETGGEQSPKLAALGLTYDQLKDAVARAQGAVIGFKSASDKAIAGLQLQIGAVGQHSPAALGELARQQALLASGSTSPQAQEQAALAGRLAYLNAQQQIVDAHKQQLLTQQQSSETARLELSIAEQSAAEQERQRASLAARQQLEQEALRLYGDRDAYDRNHLAALQKEIDAQGALKQSLAEQNALRDAAFARQQIGRTSDEQQVASTLRGVYGDNYQQYINGAVAQNLRLNASLQGLHDTGLGVLQDVNNSLRQGVPLWQSFGTAGLNALNKIGDKLLEKGFDTLFSAFLGSIGGTGGAPLSLNAGTIGGTGGWFDTGGYTGNRGVAQIAGVVHGREFVVKASETARHRPLLEAINAGRFPGFAGGGYVGPPLPPAAAANAGGAAGNIIEVHAPVSADFRGASDAAVAQLAARLAQLEKAIPKLAVQAVEEALKKQPGRLRGLG